MVQPSHHHAVLPTSSTAPTPILGPFGPIGVLSAGGELDQIQFLLGHASIQTTEQYLGCKQKLRQAVNDRIGLEPDLAS